LMETGKISFPRPPKEIDFLMKCRAYTGTGNVEIEVLRALIAAVSTKAKLNPLLPESPDEPRATALYETMIRSFMETTKV